MNRGLLRHVHHVIDGVSYTATFDYDDLGRTERIRYPHVAGPTIAVKYLYENFTGILSGLDEVGQVPLGGSARELWRLTEAYQGEQIQRERFGNGAETAYTYAPPRRHLETLTTTLPGSGGSTSVVQSLGYSYTPAGLVETLTRGTTQRTHTYDQLGRLSTTVDQTPNQPSVTGTYSHDTMGNLTQINSASIAFQATNPYRVATAGGNLYEYDPSGNVHRRTGFGIPGGVQTIDYNADNLPVSVSNGPPGDEMPIARFDYSAEGDRVVRRNLDNQTTRHFVPDLHQRLIDPNGATIEQRYRIRAGGRDLGEIVHTAAGDITKTLYFHSDHLGSPDTITSDQADVYHQSFEPFGAPIVPEAELTRIGFTGHQHDRDLGLIDMRGRIYDPLAGRFMSPDPIVQAPYWSQGQNPYAYVFNDPINATDPSGFVADVLNFEQGQTGGSILQYGFAGAIGAGVAYGIATQFTANVSLSSLGGSPGAGAAIAAGNALIDKLVGNPFASTPSYQNLYLSCPVEPRQNHRRRKAGLRLRHRQSEWSRRPEPWTG